MCERLGGTWESQVISSQELVQLLLVHMLQQQKKKSLTNKQEVSLYWQRHVFFKKKKKKTDIDYSHMMHGMKTVKVDCYNSVQVSHTILNRISHQSSELQLLRWTAVMTLKHSGQQRHFWKLKITKHSPPMVLSWYSWNWPLTKRSTRLDFPTADSPNSTSLNWQILLLAAVPLVRAAPPRPAIAQCWSLGGRSRVKREKSGWL